MQDIHDIKDLIEILPFWRQHLLLISILTALLCLGIFLFFYLKYRKSAQNLSHPPLPELSPYEQDIHDLMDAQEFMKPGLDKELSIKCSDIIRQYLEKAFHLQATERTTEEFLYNIQNEHTFHEKSLEILAVFLEMCDLAKFAKIEFTHHEQQLLLEKANRFLELAHKEEVNINTINANLHESRIP